MKKKLARVLAAVMVLCMMVLPVSAADQGVSAAVAQKAAEVKNSNEIRTYAAMNYVDVSEDDWFYDYVDAMTEVGLMRGKDEAGTIFAPYENLARAQFAVIIYRMMGGEEYDVPYHEGRFPDVAEGEWYTDAIMLASDVGIITGYTDTGLFGPADNINREQMAVMMFRFAQVLESEEPVGFLDKKEDISKFQDSASVNEFAKEAMEWAVGTKIITGKDNETRLDPQGYATRAECATIVTRFLVTYGELVE